MDVNIFPAVYKKNGSQLLITMKVIEGTRSSFHCILRVLKAAYFKKPAVGIYSTISPFLFSIMGRIAINLLCPFGDCIGDSF